jgi:hypothetical protein
LIPGERCECTVISSKGAGFGRCYFDVKWVMKGRVIDLLACWKGQRGNKMVLEVWRMAPLCLMWTIWRERNFWCFEDKELTMAEISNRFLTLLFQWAGVLNILQVSSMSQFVDFCSYCSL